MKKLLTLLLGISIATAYAVVTPLSSPQVGKTPINGYVLQTNGATSTWVATSSLGITGGSSSGVTFAYASSTFPTFSYASSTYALLSSLSSYITFPYASSTFPTFSYASSTYYFATNPSSYITLASLSGTAPISYNNGSGAISCVTATGSVAGCLTSTDWNTFNNRLSTTSANTLYYGIGNPSSFIALTALSATVPLRYNSSTGVFTTDFSTSTINTYTALNTFNGAMAFGNATGTTLSLTYGTSTNLFSTQLGSANLLVTQATTTSFKFVNATGTVLSITSGTTTNWSTTNENGTNLSYTNATSTNFGATNLTFASILGQSLATDLTGKVIATTTTGGGTTYTGTYPVIVSGSVISSGFSTSTINVFSALNTFIQASTTNLSVSGLFHDSVKSGGTSGQVLQSTGTSTLWVTNSAAGVSGTGINGFLARWTGAGTLSTGILMDDGADAGVNATSSSVDFNIKGTSANNNPFVITSSTGNTLFSIDKNGILNLATTTATTSPTNGLNLYAQDIAGQTQLALKGRGVADRMLQNAWWNSDFVYFNGGITATVTAVSTWYNTIGTQAGTAARVLPTVTSNPYTAMKRITFANVITTQNQQVGTRSEPMFFRGSGGASNINIGGFFFTARVGLTAWPASGGNLFVGLSSCTTACLTGTTTLTNLANTVGFGVERLNQNLVFLTNDASGVISTTTLTGAPALAANVMYDMYIYQSPNSPVLYWQIDNASTTATIASGIVSSNLPATTTLMAAHAQIGNGGNTGAAAVSLGVNRIYVETER